MRSFKTILLAGASALLATAALSAPASAQTTVAGAGSSLIAPYITQAMGCYVDTATSNPASTSDHVILNTLNAATLTTIGGTSCNGMGSGLDTFQDVSSSSGNGLLLAYGRTIADLGSAPSGVTYGSVVYGLSDAALAQSDIDVWSVGTSHATTPITPTLFQGKTFLSSGGNYPISEATYGKLIQIPVSIDPVAIGYNPNFASGSGHAFQIHTADSKIHLNKAAYCGIFNGDITDWNDATLTAQNGGFSLTGGVAASIHLIGRSDGSGTTAILRRHLANICTGVSVDNYYTDGPNTLPINGSNQLPNGATFTTAAGSGGVATALNSTAGGIAYIGPDYLLPAVTNTGANTFNLPAATIVNAHNSTAYAPNSANALTAFGNILPPQTNANGTYNVNATGKRIKPFDWVPGTTNSAIADPTTGYPIVGTTNIILSQHYDAGPFLALAGQAANFDPYDGFLTNYYDNSNANPCTLLSAAGLACLPSAWNAAITDTFITNASGLGLQIMTP